MRGRRVGSRAQVPAALEQLPGDLEGDRRSCRCRWRASAGCAACRRRSPPARARWRCPGSSAPATCRPCPRTARRRSGRARRSARRRSASQSSSGVGIARRHRLPRRSPCRCRRCPGRWWSRRSGCPASRRSPWPGRRPRCPAGPALGLDHRQLVVAVGQHVVGDLRLGAPARAFEAAEGDVLAPHPAAFDHAPARRLQRGVDQLGAGLGFVHRLGLATPRRARCAFRRPARLVQPRWSTRPR